MTTATRGVVSVGRDGAMVRSNGKDTVLPWGTLRAAAKQDDVALAGEYRALLSQALAAAKDCREVSVVIGNSSNTPHGYAAELRDVAGEFLTGQTVAADFGQTGSQWEADQDVARAKEVLGGKGYVVHA